MGGWGPIRILRVFCEQGLQSFFLENCFFSNLA